LEKEWRMHPSFRQRWELHLSIGLLLTALVGCGGVDIVALQRSQIEELQYENARQKDSISESLGDVARLEAGLEAAEAEKGALLDRVESLGTNLRHANSEVVRLSKESEDLSRRLADAAAARERLADSLDKVKEVASSSASELADLRLKRQEHESRVAQLTKETKALQERNGALLQDIDRLNEELVRNRAVVRALQGEESSQGPAVKAALEEISRLQEANAELKRRTEAMEERLSTNGGNAVSPRAQVAVAPAGTEPVASQRSLERTLSDLGALLSVRYRRAVSGQIAWDSVDFLIVGAMAVVGLLVVWGTIRWVRVRKVGRQLRLLNARVLELEHMQAEGGPGSLLEVPGGPRAAARREAAAPKFRRSPAMRRSGFSAVISSKDFSARQATAPTAEAVEEALEPVLATAGPSPREEPEPPTASPESHMPQTVAERSRRAEIPRSPPERPAASQRRSNPESSPGGETRKVIGARLWQESPRAEVAAGDDLVSTQIIPKVTEVTQTVPESSRLDSVEPNPRSFLREEPPAPAAGEAARSSGSRPTSSPSSDQDLLAELKAVVNRKFDELAK
jgi:hypothetical protein